MRNQVDVVKEEIRVNVLNRPYGGFPRPSLPPGPRRCRPCRRAHAAVVAPWLVRHGLRCVAVTAGLDSATCRKAGTSRLVRPVGCRALPPGGTRFAVCCGDGRCGQRDVPQSGELLSAPPRPVDRPGVAGCPALVARRPARSVPGHHRIDVTQRGSGRRRSPGRARICGNVGRAACRESARSTGPHEGEDGPAGRPDVASRIAVRRRVLAGRPARGSPLVRVVEASRPVGSGHGQVTPPLPGDDGPAAGVSA
ncbi:hypothetical protein M2302_001933 [Micromonospora sp. A200]|nr:hypothetical protein [Micromonospora sp. A200]